MTCEIVYYSATDATANIIKAFSKGLAGDITYTRIDMFSHETAASSNADLLVFASPVYGGRIPKRIMKCFEKKCAKGRNVVGIAVYGNIHFGASLAQLCELAKKHHCSFIGAGAFVAEHTFSFEDAPIAVGRPNTHDLEQATQFARAAQDKMNTVDKTDVTLPHSGFPLLLAKLPETTIRPVVKKPVIIGDCTHCGVCARICPVRAIDPDTLSINSKKCIRCFACVKKCPARARKGELILKWLRYPFSSIGGKKKEPVWWVQ